MRNKIIQTGFCTIVILVIAIMGIGTIINNNTYSESERRNLSTYPEITIKKLTQDEFYMDYTDAFADQMVFRDSLISWYYRLTFRTYSDEVVRGTDGQLFKLPLIIDNEEEYIKNLRDVISDDMNKVAKQVTDLGSEFIFISVPRKDVVMDKYLPDSYIKGNEDYLKYIEIVKEEISSNVQFVDSYEIFKANSEEYYDVYYQTDHHLNIRGGYYIFQDIISRVNEDGNNIELGKLEDEYKISSIVINGSFNRQIGQAVSGKKEELVLTPKNTSLRYTRMDSGKKVNRKIFGNGDTYAKAYMGNDYAETVVDTNNDDAPNILYVGSSYTNILEALSVYKFNKMVSIDYRHNTTGKSIAEYVKEHDIDYTIFMCSHSGNALSISYLEEQLVSE